ncbi:MAG: hypothetical protein VB013_10885 [Anaerolineaceae bacterium]|nr:hypothetical protein [Anaerolineaceae bacterium]
MDRSQYPPFKPILITSLSLLGVGIVGLVVLFSLTVPTLGPRWLLFFLITLAGSGLALPGAYFLNLRFPSTPPADANILIREALWVGLYLDLVIWLQFGKVLNFALGVLLLAGFAVIEFLLRLRERNRFIPGSEE